MTSDPNIERIADALYAVAVTLIAMLILRVAEVLV